LFWTGYAGAAAVSTFTFALETSIIVEEILKYRDQRRGLTTVDEIFDRMDRRYEVAGEFSMAAIVLAIAGFAFLAYLIGKYFAPRLRVAL
jgi:hypothetical protein